MEQNQPRLSKTPEQVQIEILQEQLKDLTERFDTLNNRFNSLLYDWLLPQGFIASWWVDRK